MTSTLILGGARSGKSARAQALAEAAAPNRVYIATAEALDVEMTGARWRNRSIWSPPSRRAQERRQFCWSIA